MTNIKSRIEHLLMAMRQGVFEREEVISLALLAAISGESIFLLGLPGVGKSMVARRLKMAFRGATSFEYLMSRFSTPDEIFGPVSITKLKDEDTYERVISGYLPTADIAFLDEIWKAGPAIQNSLLTALNERIFRNGSQDIELPLKTIISASNELPAEGEGLEALWDRFLIRYIVEPIQGRTAFLRLLTETPEQCSIDEKLKISDEEYRELKERASSVHVPELICNVICDIRDVLSDSKKSISAMPSAENTPYISDRRWRKIIGILRTSALLNGRGCVDPSDCLLLEHLLWDNDSHLLPIRRLVADTLAARVGKDLPKSFSIDDVEGMSFTDPVGELYSPDGKHYVFSAGGEDILIAHENYERLSTESCYGAIGADNILRLTPEPSAFTLKKTAPGSIVLNSFTYKMKRDSPLRSGNTDSFIRTINTGAEKVIAMMQDLVRENIFLRDFSQYPELQKAFDAFRLNKSHLKGSYR